MTGKERKKRIFDIIQVGQRGDIVSRGFDYFLVAVILLNILMLVLLTFESLSDWFWLFETIEAFTIGIFCVEYILRIWTSDLLYPEESRGRAVLRFLVSYDGIVDLLTIVPYFAFSGFVAFRMLRVVRIFHLFRINSSYDSFQVITSVLMEKKNQILSSVFIIFVLMLASSLCMYSVEHEAQPEVFQNAFSGVWWSLSTIFTVGYGDIYPVTHLGRVIAVVITFLGVGVVAIPTGIISAGFVEHYTRAQRQTMNDRYRQSSACVYVEDTSDLAGKTVRALEQREKFTVTAVIREGAVVIPSDALEIRPGDTLVYL